jgi:ferredoxin-type protein NapG
MDESRRAFFRRAAGKAAKHVVEEADARLASRASRWIRPPWARPELEFMLACTRCDACIKACPHDVLFPLPAGYGADVASTPALDVLGGGCHLCEDWPCVNACEPAALRLPEMSAEEEAEAAEGAPRRFPRLAHAEINMADCLPYQGPECGACEGSCPVPGALIWDDYRPHIDMAHCAGCGLCRTACIADPSAVLISSLYLKENSKITTR